MNTFFIAFGKATISTIAFAVVVLLGVEFFDFIKKHTKLSENICDALGIIFPIFLMFFTFFIMGD